MWQLQSPIQLEAFLKNFFFSKRLFLFLFFSKRYLLRTIKKKNSAIKIGEIWCMMLRLPGSVPAVLSPWLMGSHKCRYFGGRECSHKKRGDNNELSWHMDGCFCMSYRWPWGAEQNNNFHGSTHYPKMRNKPLLIIIWLCEGSKVLRHLLTNERSTGLRFGLIVFLVSPPHRGYTCGPHLEMIGFRCF